MKFVFVATPLSTQHEREKNTGWLVIRIICPSGVTFVSVS